MGVIGKRRLRGVEWCRLGVCRSIIGAVMMLYMDTYLKTGY